MKLDWKAVLGLAVSALLLWWIFRGEDLGTIAAAVRAADPWLLGAAVAVATAGFLIRAMRWKVLLHPLRPDTGLGNRFSAVSIGFMANNLLPARVGEFARAYAFARVEPVSISGAFGTLVVERFLDGFTLLALLGIALLSPGFPGFAAEGRLDGILEGVVWTLAAVLAALIALLIWPEPAVRSAERVAAKLPGELARPVVDALESFLDGIQVLRSPWLLIQALLWSFAFWCWHGLSFWLGFLAFDIHVGYDAALLVEAVVAFAVAIPSAPGFFGTFHAGAMWGLSVYGVDPSAILAFAFGYHLGGFIPITLIGLWYAWRLGFSLEEMQESEERVEEAVERVHFGAPRGRDPGPEPSSEALDPGPRERGPAGGDPESERGESGPERGYAGPDPAGPESGGKGGGS